MYEMWKKSSCFSSGHYRWYKKNYIVSTIIIDLVGEARRCECSGRSETCNSETGVCQVMLRTRLKHHYKPCYQFVIFSLFSFIDSSFYLVAVFDELFLSTLVCRPFFLLFINGVSFSWVLFDVFKCLVPVCIVRNLLYYYSLVFLSYEQLMFFSFEVIFCSYLKDDIM